MLLWETVHNFLQHNMYHLHECTCTCMYLYGCKHVHHSTTLYLQSDLKACFSFTALPCSIVVIPRVCIKHHQLLIRSLPISKYNIAGNFRNVINVLYIPCVSLEYESKTFKYLNMQPFTVDINMSARNFIYICKSENMHLGNFPTTHCTYGAY